MHAGKSGMCEAGARAAQYLSTAGALCRSRRIDLPSIVSGSTASAGVGSANDDEAAASADDLAHG